MSNENSGSEIILARWSDRFFAWLIDFIIISSVSTMMIFLSFGSMYYEFDESGMWAENNQFVTVSILFFVYWVILEYKTGQTIGKKILNIKITDINGGKPKLVGVLLSCFGKSFLLPFDVILGLILTNQKRQRIFNRLGDTITVRIKDYPESTNTKYTKD